MTGDSNRSKPAPGSICRRCWRSATVAARRFVTSLVSIAKWRAPISDPTYADAILDRLAHNVHRIALEGESPRRAKAHSGPIAEAAPSSSEPVLTHGWSARQNHESQP
ncbi:ATP-binding protein [Sphingopyxis sp. DBS4]|uniref:ATP-binding protein n=1 Tax=Sphingopyxis sp. DBS4 TaxID=2968500 RepID=UPI0035A61958